MADKLDNLYNLLKNDKNYSSAKVLKDPETFKNSYSTEESMGNLYNLLRKDDKYSSAAVLESPDMFKKSFFGIEPTPTKAEPSFWEGLTARFRDLTGTEKEQDKAYINEINKKKTGISAPEKSDWQVYNDFVNFTKPNSNATTPEDYLKADDLLKSHGIHISGAHDNEEDPFKFSFDKIDNQDNNLKIKDSIQSLKKQKETSINGIYDALIEAEKAKDYIQEGYIVGGLTNFFGQNPRLEELKKQKENALKQLNDQYASYNDNIAQPQLIKTNSLIPADQMGISQINKNVTYDPNTKKSQFSMKNATQDINTSTKQIHDFADQFDNPDKVELPPDATEEDKAFLKSGKPIPKGLTFSGNLYDKLGKQGINLEFSGDNENRDAHMSNFEYGQFTKNFIGEGKQSTVQSISNIEKDKFVFKGLKSQLGTLDAYIKNTQDQIDQISATINPDKQQGAQRKESYDFVNSLTQNLSALKIAKQKLTTWGNNNLTGYKKYLSSQEEIQRIDNESPWAQATGEFLKKTSEITKGFEEYGQKLKIGFKPGNQLTEVESGSERKVPLWKALNQQVDTDKLSDVDAKIIQKGIEVDLSKAEAIYKSKPGSALNPFNYKFSARPVYIASLVGIRDLAILGGIGGSAELAGSRLLGMAGKALTGNFSKEALGWTLEKQIQKNLASAAAAEVAGASTLGYSAANVGINALKFGNRVVAMTVPTALIYGNDMHNQFLDAGFTPEQSRNLAALSILFEGGSEAIFGNELRIYNALVDGTTDAALRNTATNVLEKAFESRAKEVLKRSLSKAEVSGLTRFWKGLQKFKDTRGVSSILEGGKTLIEEPLEELSTDAGNAIFTNRLANSYNPNYKGQEFNLENEMTTILNTVATMVPMALAGSGGHFKNFNKNQKIEALQAKYEVGASPEIHIGVLHDAFNKGELSKEEYEKRVVLVEKYAKYSETAKSQALPIAIQKGYGPSELDGLKFELFNAHLQKDNLETMFNQATSDEDKANFAQLISEKDEQINKYITNGVYKDDEERKVINSKSLDYLFNAATLKNYIDEKKLTAVQDQLVVQSLTEKDPELIKKYEEKINLFDARKKELLAKQTEDAKSPEQKAKENNDKSSIDVEGLGIGSMNLEYNIPYVLTSPEEQISKEGQKIRPRTTITILKDNGNGTLTVSENGEEKIMPLIQLANFKVVKQSTIEGWKKYNSPQGFVFAHENALFSFEFDQSNKTRGKIVEGRLRYNEADKRVEFVYKNKDGKEVSYKLSEDHLKNLNKGKLKFVSTLETEEGYKKRIQDEAAKLNFDEMQDEPIRRWEFILDFIEKKKAELTKTKELINTIEDKLNSVKKDLNTLYNQIKKGKNVDVQKLYSKISDLEDVKKELEWNSQILEEQKADLENQIEYTKKYETPDFDLNKTLVEELVDNQFDLELQLEKINGVIDSIKKLIDGITDTIKDILDVVDNLYEQTKKLYPKIPLDATQWTEFVRQNPNISKLKPNFAKDLTVFNSAINDNLNKIELEDARVDNLEKSIAANMSLAKSLQNNIRYQQDLINDAIKTQEKYAEQKTTKKVESIASEIFKLQNEVQTDNSVNDTEEDLKLTKEESDKIPLELFFSTLTSGTTRAGGLNLDNPSVLRLQNFLNTIADPTKYSLLVVTTHNAARYGLENIIFTDEKTKTTNTGDNQENYDIKIVFVNDNNEFVDQNGNTTTNKNEIVYTSLRKANTTYENGEKAYPIRKGQEKQYEEFAEKLEKIQRDLRSQILQKTKSDKNVNLTTSDGSNIITQVSRGRKTNQGQQNSAIGTVLPKSIDLINTVVIQIPTPSEPGHKTGKVLYGTGENINMPIGRVVVSHNQQFEFGHNKKFNKQDVDKFVRVFKAFYDALKKKDQETAKILFVYLQKTLYLRNPEVTSKLTGEKQNTKIGRSQIWFDNYGDNLLHINFGENFRIPFNFEESNIKAFLTAQAFFIGQQGKGVYHNIDNKDLIGTPFIEIVDVDKNGKLTKRTWGSYQEYLLSDKLPDKTTQRAIEDIPVTVMINPSTPNTPNRAGRYVIFKNEDIEDAVNDFKKSTKKEAPESKKKTVKKQKDKTEATDEVISYKEEISKEQDPSKLMPGKIYRWKFEKEGKTTFIDFKVSEGKWVTVIKHNYEGSSNKDVAKNLQPFLKGDKPKPGTVVIYELVIDKEGKKTTAKKEKKEEKKPEKKPEKKKEDKKTKKEKEERTENFGDALEGFDLGSFSEGGEFNITEDPTEEKEEKVTDKDLDEAFSDFNEEETGEEETDEKEIDLNNLKDIDYRTAVNTKPVLENIKAAKKWFIERFPQIKFRVFFGLIDGKAWGSLKNGVVTLSDVAEEGTIYHEAFEVVHKYMLDPRQLKALRREFKSRKGSFIDYETGKSVEYSKAIDYQIKEQLAEEYREYELSGATKKWEGEYHKNSLFRKIKDFINFIVNQLLGKPDTINEVFQKISEGAYKDYVLPRTIEAVNKEYKVAEIKKKNPVFFKNIMDSMTNIMFEVLKNQNRSIPEVLLNNYDIEAEQTTIKEKIDNFYKKDDTLELKKYTALGLKSFLKDPSNYRLFIKNFNGSPILNNLINYMKQENQLPTDFTLIDNEGKIDITSLKTLYYAMQNQGAVTLYNAYQNYNYISDNWEDLKKEHKKYLSKYNLEFEEDENQELTNQHNTDENRDGVAYAPEITKISVKVNASREVKLLIATLKEMIYDVKREKFEKDPIITARPKVNQLLMSSPVDYGATIVDLLYKFSPTTSLDEMFEVLKKQSEINASLKPLIEKLKIGVPVSKLTEYDVDLQNKFYTSLNNMRINYSKLILDNRTKSGIMVSINELDTYNNIKKKWFSATIANGNKLFKINAETKKYVLVRDNLPIMEIKTLTDAVKFLNLLGYKYNFNYGLLEKEEKTEIINAATNLYKILTTKDPELLFYNSSLVRESLNNLVKIYIDHTDTYVEPQHLNIEREPVQNILTHNFIGTITKLFNGSKTFESFVDKVKQLNPKNPGNAFLSYSQVLDPNSKFYKNGNLEKNINIEIIEGSEVREAGEGTPTSKLSLIDRIAQEFSYNLQGVYNILTPADTKTQWGINFGHFINRQESKDTTFILSIFKKYLKAEILTAQQDNPSNLAALDAYYDEEKTQKVGTSLRFFRDILPFTLDITKTADEAIKEKESEINKAILAYLDEYTDKTYQVLKKNNIIRDYAVEEEEDLNSQFKTINTGSEDGEKRFNILFAPLDLIGDEGLTDLEVKDLIRFQSINHIFNIFEQHKLFWGDPAQWKDISKRIKSFTSGRNLSVHGSKNFNDFNNKKLNTITYFNENMEEQTISLQPGDFGYVHYDDTFRVQAYEDINVINDKLEGYDKVNEADGQGLVFPNGNREIRQRANTWTPTDEEQKQWDDALCRWEVTNGVKWEDRNKQNSEKLGIKQNLYPEGERGEKLKTYDEKILSKGNPYLNRTKVGLTGAIYNVLKPIYSGFKQGLSATVSLDKLSLAPITWRMIRGKNAQEFYVEHFKKNTTYIRFESAQKVGGESNIEKLYNQEGKPNLQYNQNGDVSNIKHELLNFKYFGIQVETLTQKNKTTLGTQLTKLITMNIDKIKNKVLVDNNSKYLSALKKMSKEDIFYNFGITESVKNGKKGYEFTNYKQLEKLIQKELNSRDAAENLKEAMKINPDTDKFFLPFDLVIGSEKLESIITSIIDNNILRPKMFGGQLPQISSALFEKGPRVYIKTVKGKDYFVSNELKFYEDKDGGRHCEVYLPFYMQEYIEEGKELNIEDLPEDLKFGIGFRIPTQNLNSIEHFKIKGFLPVEYGNSITVPSEITTKAGSDFDIDKLNIYLYNYYRDLKTGKPVKIKFLNDSNSKPEERYELYKKRDPKGRAVYEEYAEKLNEITKKIQEIWEEDNKEIKTVKESKVTSEQQINALYFAQKTATDQLKVKEEYLKNEVIPFLKDYEKGIEEDYTSTMLFMRVLGYSGSGSLILQKIEQEIEDRKSEIASLKSDITDFNARLKDISLTKFKKADLDIKYEQRKKNQDYLLDSKKELLRERTEEIKNLQARFSFEEFKKLPIEMQNSRKAVENAYIDNLRAIMQLPEMFKYLIKPNSAEELKDEAKAINTLYGINKEKKSSVFSLSMLNTAEERHAFLTGKDAVGIGASQQTQHALGQLVDLAFEEIRKNFHLDFPTNSTEKDGVVKYSLSGITDKVGKVISDNISMFIDAFVDIAKDPYIFDINCTYDTAATYITGLRMGIPLPLLTRWFNQPVIREYMKLEQQNKSISTKLTNSSMSKKDRLDFVKDIFEIKGDVPERNSDFTAEELEQYIKDYVANPDTTSIEFKQAQHILLNQFLQLVDLQWELFRFGQAINIDTTRTVSFESIRLKMAKVNLALQGRFSDYVVKIYKETFIGTIYHTKNDLLKAIKPLYLTESDAARSVLNPLLNKIYQSIGRKDALEEEAKKIRKHFITYLFHTMPIKIGNIDQPVLLTSYINDLLLSDKNIALEVRSIQEKEDSRLLPQNFFLKQLLGEIPSFINRTFQKTNNVRLLRKISDKTDSDLATADFRNLANDARTEELLYNLIKTTLLQSGLNADPMSFLQLIPNDIFQDISKQIEASFENSADLKEILNGFIASYYQNQWYNPDIVKKAEPIRSYNEEGEPVKRQKNYILEKIPEIFKGDKWDWQTRKETVSLKNVSKENIQSVPFLEYFVESDDPNFSSKYFSKEAKSPYLLIRTVNEKYSFRQRNEMARKGDFSFLNTTLYKRLEVKRADGVMDIPLIKKYVRYDKETGIDIYQYNIVFYPVNAYGERFNLVEHYRQNQKSAINPSFGSITDAGIYRNLWYNNKISERFVYEHVFPNLQQDQEDFMKNMENAFEVNELLEETQETNIPSTEVKNVKTLQDVEDNAIAVIKSTKGDDKYIFLNSQKDLFGDDLVSDDKQGQRIKGKNYKGIDIVSDYFTSKTIKDKSGNDTVDILFVDSKEVAQKQFDNYIEGGAKQFLNIEFKNINKYDWNQSTEQNKGTDFNITELKPCK